MLPQRVNPDSTGRSEVFNILDEHLLPRKPDNMYRAHMLALCGMGGIGKTDIAVEYAYLQKQRSGAVFWLEAGGVSQLASDFGRMATHLGLESSEEAKDLIRASKSQKRGSPNHEAVWSLRTTPGYLSSITQTNWISSRTMYRTVVMALSW